METRGKEGGDWGKRGYSVEWSGRRNGCVKRRRERECVCVCEEKSEILGTLEGGKEKLWWI